MIDYEYCLWTGIKVCCPICKKTFTGWYCPSCGLPKKNSKYALSKYGSLQNCSHYHFRPEFSSFENFQLCSKCYTTNPFNAKYCRNCGKKIMPILGVDKNAHGWVDLGLSVLWATETMKSSFRWMGCKTSSEYNLEDGFNYIGDGKDAATEIWGIKWRIPTKEEFEELFTKCRWERCIDPISKRHSFKATGPNGNSIIITLNRNDMIALWTSTEYTAKHDGKAAYAFIFRNDIKIEKTLTAKQKKEMEFATARFKRENEGLRMVENVLLGFGFSNTSVDYDWEKRWAEKRKREDKEREISRQEQDILDAMGDDRQERENNEKKDKAIHDNLWINAPVKFSFNEDFISNNIRKHSRKSFFLGILPVADKKWKGKL